MPGQSTTVRSAAGDEARVRPAPVRLRPLLLPVEHGGWGFLFEPIVIALVAAPSAAAAWLSVVAVLAFLARHPLKIGLDDRRHRRRVPRTRPAWMLAITFLLSATLALAIAHVVSGHPFWLVLLLASPAAAVQVWHDARGSGRTLAGELAGAKALAAVAGASGLAAGLWWPYALALWATALVRVLPAIVTVRERVQRLHGHAPDRRRPALAHAAAVAGAFVLAGVGLMPRGVPAVAVLLAARAGWDLRRTAPATTAVRIGVRELVTGLVAAAALGTAWRLGW